MEKRNSSWRRAAAVAGVVAMAFAACSARAGRADRQERHGHRPLGRRRGEGLQGNGRPLGGQERCHRQYTGTRDLNAVLTTGVASGVLPDMAACRDRVDGDSPRAVRSSPSTGSFDIASTRKDCAGARRARYGRWQDFRRLHQGRREGPDLVQPQAS